MNRTTTLALAAALGAGALGAGAANAQEFRRDFDNVASTQADEGDGVRLRLSLPFAQTAADPREAALSFGFTHSMGNGEMRSLDLLSLSLAGATPHLGSPLAMNVNGDGEGWLSNPRNQLLLGLGAGLVIWAIVDANQDDTDPPPQNN